MTMPTAVHKILDAQEILRALGLAPEYVNQVSALTLLALAGLGPEDSWRFARRASLRISKEIMPFAKQYYGIEYKPNTRESFRKTALNPFVQLGIAELNPDNKQIPQTSSLTHYALSFPAINTIKNYGTPDWPLALENFIKYKSEIETSEETHISIKKIYINNYKTIWEDTIALGRVNVFIGANGSGKSNILEALAFLGASVFNDLNHDGLYSRGVRLAKPELMFSSFSDLNTQSNIVINLSVEVGGEVHEIKSSFTPKTTGDLYTSWVNLAEEELIPEVLMHYFKEITEKKPGISGNELLKEANLLLQQRGFKKKNIFDQRLSEYSIFDLNTKALRGIVTGESKKTPLGLNGEGLDLLIASFTKAEREYLRKCSSFFGWLEEIVADKDDKLKLQGLKAGRSISKLYFKDSYMQQQNNTLSAENSNEGILHVLFYLSLLTSNTTPSLFAIDNIETALNPRICQALIMEIAHLAKEKNKQVLITTHNPAILDGLNLLDDDQRLFEVYRDSNGHTKTKRIQFKKDLTDKKGKLSEMWLKGIFGIPPENF